MTNFRITKTRRGFYVEQSYRCYNEVKWGDGIGPIPTREEAEELMLELEVDVMMAAKNASEAGLRYIGA